MAKTPKGLSKALGMKPARRCFVQVFVVGARRTHCVERHPTENIRMGFGPKARRYVKADAAR